MEFFSEYEWLITGVVIVVVAILVLSMRAGRGKKLRAAVEAVAAQFGGTVKPGGGISMPQLHFLIRDYPVGLVFLSRSHGATTTYITRLYLELSSTPEVEIRLEPEDFFSKMEQSVAGEDIQVGDAEFDNRYAIRGFPAESIRRLLSADIRAAVDEIRLMKGDDHVQVSTYENYFRVQKYSWLDDADTLARFIELGKRILDGFLG